MESYLMIERAEFFLEEGDDIPGSNRDSYGSVDQSVDKVRETGPIVHGVFEE